MKLDGYHSQGGAEPPVVTQKVQASSSDSYQSISHDSQAGNGFVGVHLDQTVLHEVVEQPLFILLCKAVRINSRWVRLGQLPQYFQLFLSEHIHRVRLAESRWLIHGIFGVLCLIWGLLWAVPAFSASRTDIPPAYVVAAQRQGIPPAILYAVATAESVVTLNAGRRPWPWTLNVAGKALRFGDRSSACAALRDALQRTNVVDVGIAQLNVRWQPQLFGPGRRFADPCDGLDPYANLDEAARLLRQHYDASGDWLIAAGRYHRPAGGRPAERYRSIVRTELLRLVSGSPIASAASAPLKTPSGPSTPSDQHHDSKEAEVTWITPSPRSREAEITWLTPEPRRWLAEVASR